MNFKEYETDRALTDVTCKDGLQQMMFVLGLGEEAGEVLGKFKKATRGDRELDIDSVKKELGDVLWYLTKTAHSIGSTLEEVATLNLKKLNERLDKGTIKGSGDNR